MNQEDKSKSESQKDGVMQDGVFCPNESPWPAKNMKWTTASMLPTLLVGIYVLAHTNIAKLIIWLIIWVIFAYPLRYLICARCPYYGKNCSTYYGIMVKYMFKKQEGKSMKTGLWLDIVFFLIIIGLPIPEMWQFGGIIMLPVWFGTMFLMSIAIGGMGCKYCPLTFCPVGKMNRMYTKFFDKS